MRVFKLWMCIGFVFFLSLSLFGQTEPDLPADGEGQALDEPVTVPISGEFLFILAALGVGGGILLLKHKRHTTECDKK